MKAAEVMRGLLVMGMLLVSVHAQETMGERHYDEEVATGLKRLLERNASQVWVEGDIVTLSHMPELQRFYRERNYRPGWEKTLQKRLMQAIEASAKEGLDPENRAYHRTLLKQLAAAHYPGRNALLELLMSDAFMTLGGHLFRGVLYEKDLRAAHHDPEAKYMDLPALLETALETGRIGEALEILTPDDAGYRNLKKALARYETLAWSGGWNEDPEAYRDIEAIRQRLAITGEYFYEADCPEFAWMKMSDLHRKERPDLEENATECYILEEGEEESALESAIKAFQKRHNIKVDGIVGPKTRKKLAEGVKEKLKKIRLNLERWRWFGPFPTDPYVIVNVPDFSLQMVNGDRRLTMKVVVGREGRKTPTMIATMRYLVVNPYWRIPKTILAEDILPRLRADPGYLASHEITLFSAADPKEKQPLDPATIDWNQMSGKGMQQYIFRQEAGPKNPLGVIKFIFPNRYDIYIHDTPARYLFARDTLLASSGCIRAEKPIELAYEILRIGQPEITRQEIRNLIRAGEHKIVRLKEGIPVYITYRTAWADEEGNLFTRADAYGYDAGLEALLGKRRSAF